MKRLFVIFFVIVLAFAAISCGKKDIPDNTGDTDGKDTAQQTEKKETPFELPDLKAAVEYMVNGLEMTDMTELDADSLMLRYGILDKYTDVYAIVSASIASDECVIFKANDASAAKEIVELLKTYRNERIELYNGYAPEEAPRLESAYIAEKNGYVIFATTLEPKQAESLFLGLPETLEG